MGYKENAFGDRLRVLRRIRDNKTQKEFASELGIPQPTLSAYESGKIKPTIDAVINIADKCDVSIDWLCGRDETVKLKNLGDVLSCFLELYETNEFSIKTTIHDRVDMEDMDSEDDDYRNWVELKIYHNEARKNAEFKYNLELCKIITDAYKLTQQLKRYERDQDGYNREKGYYVERNSDYPITKIDHSKVSEEERREKMTAIIKKELENNNSGPV